MSIFLRQGKGSDDAESARLLQEIGAEELLDLLGSEVVEQKGLEIEASCPVCGKEKGHFYLNAETGFWFCHAGRHNQGGVLVSLVAAVQKVSEEEARAWLASLAGEADEPSLDRIRNRLRRAHREEDEEEESDRRANLPREAMPVSGPALEYLERRGITREIALRWGMCWTKTGSWKGRVLIPILDSEGEPFTFTGRAYLPGLRPSWRHPRDVPVSSLLSAYPWGDEVVLVEGLFDAIAWGARGVPASSLFGARLSKAQAAIVASRWRRVTLALDPDPAGRKGTQDAIRKLEGLVDEIRVADLPAGSDPDEVDPWDVLPGRLVQPRRTWNLMATRRKLRSCLREVSR